ncbi:DUF5320 domain-containing protein [bacterium]|nr:DUF5320 domain-containing protein [bacterium]
MPFRDGSGPNGSGPMTGRGMGNCNSNRDFADDFCGRGRGYGRGYGMGRRNGGRGYGYRRGFGFEDIEDSPASYNKSYLESIVNYLSDKLNSFKQRLDELEDKK